MRHRRERPRAHELSYDTWQLLVDVDELPDLDRDVVGFAYGGRAPVTIRDTDHLGPVDLPLREKLRRFLAGHGVALPAGRLLLLTTPRVLGQVFNPVSWWYAFEQDGSLGLVVAEVRNTFGDTHCYVLDELEPTGPARVEATADKAFHVSPFLPIDGLSYRFVVRVPSLERDVDGERTAVHMDVSDADGHLFSATQGHERRPLTSRALWPVLARTPLIALKTVAAIHWEALFIWRRKARFHPRPQPPSTGYDAIALPRSASTSGAPG